MRWLTTLRALARVLSHFQVSATETGHVALVHRSGSRLVFAENGNVELWAARNLRQEASRILMNSDSVLDRETGPVRAEELASPAPSPKVIPFSGKPSSGSLKALEREYANACGC